MGISDKYQSQCVLRLFFGWGREGWWLSVKCGGFGPEKGFDQI